MLNSFGWKKKDVSWTEGALYVCPGCPLYTLCRLRCSLTMQTRQWCTSGGQETHSVDQPWRWLECLPSLLTLMRGTSPDFRFVRGLPATVGDQGDLLVRSAGC